MKVLRKSSILILAVLVAGVSLAVAQESKLTEQQKSKLIKRFPKSDANKDGKLDDAELTALRPITNQWALCKRRLNVDDSEVRLVGEARPLCLT